MRKHCKKNLLPSSKSDILLTKLSFAIIFIINKKRSSYINCCAVTKKEKIKEVDILGIFIFEYETNKEDIKSRKRETPHNIGAKLTAFLLFAGLHLRSTIKRIYGKVHSVSINLGKFLYRAQQIAEADLVTRLLC